PEWDPAPLLARGEPLPLVLFDAPCLMRARAIRALDDAGIPWRIAFTSQSLGGIWAAVQAGLGITVRSAIGMPASLATLGGVLPSPGTLGVVLLTACHETDEARSQLQRLLTDAVHHASAWSTRPTAPRRTHKKTATLGLPFCLLVPMASRLA
ncbi:LysR substrate-binding domain-containing protein, partial [Aeromonas caviae]